MPFVDLIHEYNEKISINTDYIIAIGETSSGRTYVTTTRNAIYLAQDYQTVMKIVQEAIIQNQKEKQWLNVRTL